MNRERLLLTDVIEWILYLCKINLLFVPYFSCSVQFIYILYKEKLPDSYDKCEPGLNGKTHLHCKNREKHLVCTRGESLVYNLIRICPTALHQYLNISIRFVRCATMYELTLLCVRTYA